VGGIALAQFCARLVATLHPRPRVHMGRGGGYRAGAVRAALFEHGMMPAASS